MADIPGMNPVWPALREELHLREAGINRDGSPAWHLNDPVRNLWFRLGWLEVEILKRWPRGNAQAIAEDINAETTLHIVPQDVEDFVGFLQQHQLLKIPRYRPEKSLWTHLLHSYLFIRIPLLHPARMLSKVLPWVSILFSRTFLLLTLAAGLTGLLFAARQWDSVEATLRTAVSWQGALGFILALIFSKCWHELGHAFMATRYGVRVGHMGVALLVMLPMAYTDTGESWKLNRSTQRLKIACAGIMAELVLAAWATLLWSFAPEGMFKNALFFLATTAWVMTVMINASPFMRFDGYFILCDWLDFPGLHERAGQWAKRAMRQMLFGLQDPLPDNVSPGFSRFLILFAFATWIYRLMLFIGIAIVVYHAFFKALGVVLFLIEMMTFVVLPMIREMKVWWLRRHEIRPTRRVRIVLVLGVLLAGVLLPWSRSVSLPGVIDAALVQPLYTPFGARMLKINVSDGEAVKKGQLLFELVAPQPETDEHKALAMRQAWEASARGAQGLEKESAARQVLAEQMARQFALQQQAGSMEMRRLQLVAAIDGRLEERNLTFREGSWISPGDRIATVIDRSRWHVDALVSEDDLGRIKPGARAKVFLPGQVQPVEGTVLTVDQHSLTKLPSLALAKASGGEIVLAPGIPAKELKPEKVWYRVSIQGQEASDNVTREMPVQVVVESDRQSLAHRWINSAMLMLIQQSGLGKEG
ncbi:HlyD family efflux transporter periplasmic adaptor subunit [Leclercia adecarboxylata]|uniref:HlyD family efflux transporter periplasmic adaptor subunit n=1 Tax=Leclercia adecarboxylata TaxID=83655 RepID=UPI002DBF7D0B|nr:HlyD family efflux transporter periplasmic adaptor subunit [Leclercia adecarboxylata]MEB6381621.1 HlyD family efflux transporter periplasmic adaptor subunit [Leclercia adecarboxylata]